MSINVTVSGNPVSIKRGKMVTANPYDEKQEYEKRRLMRLEQVRQQSKEFAQDVRNKVGKEKKKQLGQIDRESKEKLKSWQNRKLLDLQNQYREALGKIGMGHKAAVEFVDEDEVIEQEKLQNEMTAQARGKVAAVKSQIEKNEANYRKAQPIQQRKLVRDIENTRAAMVSSLPKHKKIKKCRKRRKKTNSTGINITIPESPSDTTEESSESLKSPRLEKNTSDFECWDDCSCSENSEAETEKSSSVIENIGSTDLGAYGFSKPAEKPPLRRPLVDQTSYRQSVENHKKLIDDFQSRSMEFPRDTRISDRIRQRERQASEPDFCDFATKVKTGSAVHNKPKSPKKKFDSLVSKENLDPNLDDVCECIHYHSACPCKSKVVNEPFRNISVQTDQYPSKDKCTCNHHQSECPKALTKNTKDHSCQGELYQFTSQHSVGLTAMSSKTIPVTNPPHTNVEIPSRPAVTITGMGVQSQNVDKNIQSISSVKKTTTTLPESQKVSYYNHQSRYQGTLPTTITVEKIGPESLEALPNVVSEAEWHEKIKQRDKEAEIRGRKAMEKELIRRDYEEMMKKLPLVQRKEHIAGIGRDRPEYHMSEDRLKELEMRKQLKLENAFTKAFPDLKPAIVTLPSKRQAVPINSNEPFEILDPGDPRMKSRGTWDNDYNSPKMFTTQEVQEIIRSFTGQKQEDRYSKLKQLLKSLKMQKEQLIQELKALPHDESVNALLNDLNSVSDSDEGRRSKHRKEEKDIKQWHRKDRERKRKHKSSEDPSSSSDSRTKEGEESENYKHKQERISRKSKKKGHKVLILQNMSTQTTPNAIKTKPSSSVSTKSLKEKLNISPSTNICNKIHSPCDCTAVKTYGSSEEVCQIVIKLQDNEDPKIEVLNKGEEKKESIGRRKEKENGKDSVGNNLVNSKKRRSGEDNSFNTLKPVEIKSVGSLSKSKEKSIKSSPRKVDAKVGPDIEVFKKPLPKRPLEISNFISSGANTNKSDSIKSKKERSRVESWQEHLSRNSMSTSSTSYLSPPDFLKLQDNMKSFYNSRHKPQQENVSTESFNTTNADPNILKYINKLINMSKASVDDLQVSSSDVQTPSQSVIEMESNNPLAQLHNIVKFINMKASEVAQELSYSTDNDISVPPNSSVNTTDNSQTRRSKSVKKSDQSLERPQLPERDSNESSRKSRESLLHQYSDVTDSCSKRIANLAAMIEKLRQEKMVMLKDSNEKLESPTSAKEYSTTAYLDLPHSEKSAESSKSSTTTSLDEEEVNRRLLEIDMNLAEKLKKFSQTNENELQGNGKRSNAQHQNIAGHSRELSDEENQQFLERLRRLMEKSDDDQTRSRSPMISKSTGIPQLPSFPQEASRPSDLPRSESSVRTPTEPSNTCDSSCGKSKPAFVPLLLNIPQLPILETVPDDYVSEENNTGGHKHPPPSKGLAAIKRLNGNVSVMPHELSTIVEADSQLSTKISPNTSRLSNSPNKEAFRTLDRTDIPKSDIDGIPPLIIPDKSLTSHYKERNGQTNMDRRSPRDRLDGLKIAEESSKNVQEHQIASQSKSITSKSIQKKTSELVRDKSSLLEKSSDFVNKSDQENSTSHKKPSEQNKKTRSEQQSNTASTQYNESEESKSQSSPQTSKSTTDSSSSSIVCTDLTCSNLSCNASKSSSGTSSSDDMKSLEAMLKSIGMEWAIPTLHKTQEALALASSSSSPEVTSFKKTQSKSSNAKDSSPCGSDVSLKKFLMKQVMNKISSSSMKSEASPGSFCQELSDISAIQALSGSEKMKQRTSTPLGCKATCKSTKDSENVPFFTGVSDISSVKASPKKSMKNDVQKKTDEEVFKSLSESARSSSNLE